MRLAIGLLLAAATCGTAFAEDPPKPKWSGEVSAGSIVTTGNSDSSTINAKGEVVYQSEHWRNTSNASAIRTEQTDATTGDDITTAERYTVGNKTDSCRSHAEAENVFSTFRRPFHRREGCWKEPWLAPADQQ